MKLTNCPVCQQQASPKAKACPSCGHPIRKPESATQLFFGIVFLAAMLLMTLDFATGKGNQIFEALMAILAVNCAAVIARD
jgi:hypothetical protein